ncbi:MAG: TIGR04372 family glycosyltransferase [Nisaea sp.]|uniref:TIGR04372 family glycosyltransferase n=1 Tax=Nisaea sp. TaxID=2024842 RepID=UPI001B20E925|nr:TIGR04372 family glycosyltransferase [Nisaea sp.]MBO6561491.1 TIGR04372 family glycosyltransferase [Nisaea sp.]
MTALLETVGPHIQDGSRALAYIFPLPGRIGHLVLEPLALMNLYGESHAPIVVITHDARLHKHSTGVRRLLEPHMTIAQTMKRKLISLGHVDAGAVEIGPMTWLLSTHDALQRDLVLALESGKPLRYLTAPEDLLAEGRDLIRSMGYEDDKPSVVLHVRDEQFLPQFTHNFFRAARVADYMPAIDYLLSKGYRIFRLGDPSSVAVTHPSRDFVDLPHHPNYRDILDVYCIATARFSITCSSGPEAIVRAMNRPMVMVNGYAQYDQWMNPGDLLLFKTYRDKATGRPLSYDEILARDLFLENTVAGFENQGVLLEDNRPEEVLDAVMEMEARLNGAFVPESSLEDRFAELSVRHLDRFRRNLPERGPGDFARIETYAYALPWTRYCQSFLEKNAWFLNS